MTASVFAQQDMTITAIRKKLDMSRSRQDGNTSVTTKDIVYDVTLTNKTFKPLKGLEVKYMIFYKDAQAGGTEKITESSVKGAEKVADIEANRSFSFQTKSLQLTTEQLDGNWYYANGGASRAEDRVTGVWFRVYSEGKMIAEYSNPSTIAKRQKWQD